MSIKLYTGPSCSACTKLKALLEAQGITTDQYEEANVNEKTHRAAVVDLGFRGIPLLVKYDDSTGKLIATLMGASYPTGKYKEFFTGDDN